MEERGREEGIRRGIGGKREMSVVSGENLDCNRQAR